MFNETIFEIFPILETERLILRRHRLEDINDIHSIRSNEECMKYMDSNVYTLEESEEYVIKNINSFDNKDGIGWILIDKTSNEVIGDFSYWKLDKYNNRGEIGYSLKPKYQKKGLMNEAMNLLINYGFNIIKLHRIEANINPNNNNSRNVLIKNKFQKEAYYRENYYYNGKYLDSEIYSLLKSDLESNILKI